jgi:hypothetical protein
MNDTFFIQIRKTCLLLFAVSGLFFAKAEAQSSSVTVTNHTPCDIYYLLRGSRASGPCSSSSKSSTLFIPAFGTVTYANPTAVPIATLSATDYIIGARVLNKPVPSCIAIPSSQIDVVHPCAGTPPTDAIDIISSSCSICARVTAVWTPSPQALDFY